MRSQQASSTPETAEALTTPEALADQRLHEFADLPRVLADDEVLKVAQAAEDRLVMAFERRLPEPGESLVGVQENVEIVAVRQKPASRRRRTDQDGFDLCDFHGCLNFLFDGFCFPDRIS